MSDFDVIIIGAGAAGLMAAAVAGKRGKRVWLIDHAHKTAEKIRISGGGRCNFTNIHAKPENYLSQNLHFCRSALGRYRPADFIALVDRHGIRWHEKKLGQLFCDDSSQQIIDMLLAECADAGVRIDMGTHISAVEAGFRVDTNKGAAQAPSLVIATGGLSIPKIGATKFGYDIAKQFGHDIVPTRAGLVPLTFTDDMAALCREMTGLSVEAEVKCGKAMFAEGLLFTHRGLSGPAPMDLAGDVEELQGKAQLEFDFVPELTREALDAHFVQEAKVRGARQVATALPMHLQERVRDTLVALAGAEGTLAGLSKVARRRLVETLKALRVPVRKSLGFEHAEVTRGGVALDEIDARTMQSRKQPGLYLCGELLDVDGPIGGFNFQAAFATARLAGLHA